MRCRKRFKASAHEIKKPCTRAHSFFKRSDSTICLGGEAPDPFNHSLDESLPLATKPHLLHPHARLQDLFKVKSSQTQQFKSLHRIGLLFANLRHKAPQLNTTELCKAKSKKIELKKDAAKTSSYVCKLEKRILKLAAGSRDKLG